MLEFTKNLQASTLDKSFGKKMKDVVRAFYTCHSMMHLIVRVSQKVISTLISIYVTVK